LTRVFLVRHGSHDLLGTTLCGRRPGVILNARGQDEALRAAARLRSEKLAAVYSSPMERALQTAGPIAETLQLQVQLAKALNELDLGEWSGLGFGALSSRSDWKSWNTDRSQNWPPGGETMLEVQVRFARWLEEIRARHLEAVAAVTHGDVIKAALALALGLSVDQHARMVIDPGSISMVEADDWGLRLCTMNEVPA
jgi:probable phosphoglycerate mutase